jgi:hypothetical protein
MPLKSTSETEISSRFRQAAMERIFADSELTQDLIYVGAYLLPETDLFPVTTPEELRTFVATEEGAYQLDNVFDVIVAEDDYMSGWLSEQVNALPRREKDEREPPDPPAVQLAQGKIKTLAGILRAADRQVLWSLQPRETDPAYLLSLPREERDRILRAQAEQAAPLYKADLALPPAERELTAFTALDGVDPIREPDEYMVRRPRRERKTRVAH